MSRRRWILLLLLALAAAVGGYLLFAPPRVEVVRAEFGPLEQRLVATGRVMSPERIGLGSRTLGQVESVLVEEGDRVSPGQVLIRIADDEAAAAAENAVAVLAQAQSELERLERVARRDAAESATRASVEHAQAERDYRRFSAMAEEGYASQAAAEARREAMDLAASRLRSARQALRALEPGGSEHRAASARVDAAAARVAEARARLGYAGVRAPTAGIVIDRRVEPGDVVQPGGVLLLLASAGATLIELPVDERNLSLLRLGQPALGSADAYPEQRFHATVSFIGAAVDPARGTVRAELTVAEPPEYLRADMTVSVDILVNRRERALILPREAVLRLGADSWVLAVQNGRTVRQAVEPGLVGDTHVEIRSGLAAGERVLRNPAGAEPGRRVRAAEEGS